MKKDCSTCKYKPALKLDNTVVIFGANVGDCMYCGKIVEFGRIYYNTKDHKPIEKCTKYKEK